MSLRRTLWALLKSNDRRFVELLGDQAGLCVRALELLEEYGRQSGARDEVLAAVKEVEREGDEARRILIDELIHTYATPFDREDLFALSRTVDDILDAANETAVEMSMYRIPPPESLRPMAAVLLDGAHHIQLAVRDLLDHPQVAAEHAIRAKRSENRIDAQYHEAVAALFESGRETSEILKVREIYRHLKNSADRIDQAADQISIIVIKRS
ncbi:MAG: DUF47 domain-containing protein [Candidatus Dormibacteraceae bacterium]